MSKIESSVYSAFTVHEIRVVYFSLNEMLFADLKNNKIKFEIARDIGANEERKLINLTMRVFLHFDQSNEILTDIKVKNIFHVGDLDQHINNDRLKLPSDTIVSMVSVAIAHTRALLANHLAGTPLDKTILPIVNPLLLSQKLFPDLFNNKGLQKSRDSDKDKKVTKRS